MATSQSDSTLPTPDDANLFEDQQNRERATASAQRLEVHQKTLRKFLDHWLSTNENCELLEVGSKTELLKVFNPEDRFKNSKENFVQVTEKNLDELRDYALKEIGVTILYGKGRDAYLGPFEKRKLKLQQAHGLKELHVPAPRNGITANTSDFFTEAGYRFTDIIEICGKELQDAHALSLRLPKKQRKKTGASDPAILELPRVALGGGKTLFDMLDYLPETRQKFRLLALNYATRQADTDMHDSTNVALFAHRFYRWQSTVHVKPLTPLHLDNPKAAAQWHSRLYRLNSDIKEHFKGSLDPHVVFVGTGNFHPDSPSISRFYNNLGIDYATLEKYRPVGDINLCFFDADGNDLTPRILRDHIDSTYPTLKNKLHDDSFFPQEPYSHPFLLGLNIERLKQLVAMGRRVIVVAAGSEKVAAIHTLMEKKIINGLITDEDTLNQLIKKCEGR